MRKVILFFLITFYLTACSHHLSPERAYQKGHYVESVLNMADILSNETKQPITPKQGARFQTLATIIVNHYEQQLADAATNDYFTRIKAYQALLALRQNLHHASYQSYIPQSLNQYSLSKLKILLAKQYYDYAKSSPNDDNQIYLEQARPYWQQMDYSTYKQPLYITLDKQYRRKEAHKLYQQAKALIQTSHKRSASRQAASKFQLAADLYTPLGKFKDAEKLANKYWQQGKITLYVPHDKFRAFVQQQLISDNIIFTSDAQSADIKINLSFALPDTIDSNQSQIIVQASGDIQYTGSHNLLKLVEHVYPVYQPHVWVHHRPRKHPHHINYVDFYPTWPIVYQQYVVTEQMKSKQELNQEITFDLQEIRNLIQQL